MIMKRFKLILCTLLLSFGTSGIMASGSELPKNRFIVDTSSAAKYVEMAKNRQTGVIPTSEDWDSLFSTKAYKVFLENTFWDKSEFKKNVKDAFEIAFDPNRTQECDSLIKILEVSDNELPFYVSTAKSIRDNLTSYYSFLNNIDLDSVITAADDRARDLLPKRGKGIDPEISPIYFIVWDLECRSLDSGIYLDLNSFLQGGRQAAIEVLAHEMHHFYMNPLMGSRYKSDIKDAAARTLLYNMMEGTADIINKKNMPLESLAPYGDNMLKIYNDDYFSTPSVLAGLDSITVAYLDKKISEKKYRSSAMSCAHFGGHTTGDFMVFLIRDRLGLDAVIDSFCDLEKFVKNYNKAARLADTYQFSDRFINHIIAVANEAKKE